MGILIKNSPQLTGTAVAADVATGKTFYNTSSLTKITGTYIVPSAATHFTVTGATDYPAYNTTYQLKGVYNSAYPYFADATNTYFIYWVVGLEWLVSATLGDVVSVGTYVTNSSSILGTYTTLNGPTDNLSVAYNT